MAPPVITAVGSTSLGASEYNRTAEQSRKTAKRRMESLSGAGAEEPPKLRITGER
jgi:hypothetical protein